MCYDLKAQLDDGSFWKNYLVRKSLADGHCFIYSLVTGIESMHTSWCISSREIIDALKHETITNSKSYIPCVGGASHRALTNDMNAYVSDKIYNTIYGDLVPQILASALQVNMIIIC